MKNSKKKALEIYQKNEEVIKYLFFGGCGFFVALISFEIPRMLGVDIVTSNIISWIIAVIFMYFTNRKFVFKSNKKDKKSVTVEIISFFAARVFTLLLETLCILLIADVLHWGDLFAKCVGQFVVIVTNYILSKFWIFKKKE